MNWELEEREGSGCQQALMANRCGGTPSLLPSLEPCTLACSNTHIVRHSEEKEKQNNHFGVNSLDGRDGCGGFYAEGPNWEKYHIRS